MTKTTPETGAVLAGEVAVIIAGELRRRWPRHTDKHAARLCGAAPETARRWLAGQMPANKHLLTMLAAFGPRFAAVVLAPCGEWTRAIDFEARMVAVRAELDELAVRRARLEGEFTDAGPQDDRRAADGVVASRPRRTRRDPARQGMARRQGGALAARGGR